METHFAPRSLTLWRFGATLWPVSPKSFRGVINMSQLRRVLLTLVVVGGLSALTLGAAAAGKFAVEEPLTIAEAGGEEEDSLHVSDETLATSLFIPFCFVGATLAVFIWAVRSRARREDDEIPMPWWRTRQWYTRGTEEEA